MLHYFESKDRAGMVVNVGEPIKEMYIVPMSRDDRHFRHFMRFDNDKLVAILVTGKVTQPQPPLAQALQHRHQRHQPPPPPPQQHRYPPPHASNPK